MLLLKCKSSRKTLKKLLNQVQDLIQDTRGKRDSTKRHHHKQNPDEQQFPTQVVTS